MGERLVGYEISKRLIMDRTLRVLWIHATIRISVSGFARWIVRRLSWTINLREDRRTMKVSGVTIVVISTDIMIIVE